MLTDTECISKMMTHAHSTAMLIPLHKATPTQWKNAISLSKHYRAHSIYKATPTQWGYAISLSRTHPYANHRTPLYTVHAPTHRIKAAATLHATTKSQHQVQRALLLNVVVGQRAAILQLFACKDQALLVRRDACTPTNPSKSAHNGTLSVFNERDSALLTQHMKAANGKDSYSKLTAH